MTVPNFMSKAFFYQELCRMGGHYVPPFPLGMIRQKYPGADRVNNLILADSVCNDKCKRKLYAMLILVEVQSAYFFYRK